MNYNKFENWCRKIDEGYLKNPYHTNIHAADVTQTCLNYLKLGKINEICNLTKISKCGLFLSCMCHDYKHPGVNNNYLKETKNLYALTYNDASILENMHISETFKLINLDKTCNIFDKVDSNVYKQFRKEMISCVLATDMAFHNNYVNFLKEKLNDYKINGHYFLILLTIIFIMQTHIIIKDYKNFLEHSNITPNGKILLSPLIKQIIDDIYNSFKTNIYNLLFILISGDIDKSDYKALTNSLILSGHLPLSIIVIGVGNHDFTACKDLFNINNKYSSEGMPKNRDNIIFATLKKKSGSISTVEYCLNELKKQIIEFYQMIRYKEKNEVNVKDSFAKISIMFEKNSPEEKGLKESYFRPEEKTPTPDGKFFLPGEDDPYISNNSISNNSNSNNSNSNIQFGDSNNPINKEQNRYILKDSSINSEPVTPVGSFNYIENSQEEKKEENKKGKEGTSGGSGFNSTKGSDLKESGFSIFNKDNK
jgi:hypothetical protein